MEEKKLYPNRGPRKSTDESEIYQSWPERPSQEMPSGDDPPFCDACGHVTAPCGTGFKCLNCGHVMEMEGEKKLPAARPSESGPFLLYGLGGEKIGIEFRQNSITFFVPSGKDNPEIRRELDLLRAMTEEAARKGVPFRTTRLNLPGGDEVDIMSIPIGQPEVLWS